MSTRQACADFTVSHTCYRYMPTLSDENERIADWLLRLAHHQHNWGFGLCFLYLRNVKHFGWNHKRVYRIYRELELNLRMNQTEEASGTCNAAAVSRAGGDQSGLVDGLYARPAKRWPQLSPVQRAGPLQP